MKNTAALQIQNSLSLPYLIGIFLGINSFKDVVLIVDGLNCVMSKARYIHGNNDIYSNLLSMINGNRIVYTMNGPVYNEDSEKKLESLINQYLNSGLYKAIFITSLPFMKVAYIDYNKIIKKIKSNIPIIYINTPAIKNDWIDGYKNFIYSIINYLNDNYSNDNIIKPKTVSIIGYLYDRNEFDNYANIKEIEKIINICGYDLLYTFPSGTSFKEVFNILKSEIIVNLPYTYGIKKYFKTKNQKIFDLPLPIGTDNIMTWINSLAKNKIKAKLQTEKEIAKEIKKIIPILDFLSNKNAIYFGEPFLAEALSNFLNELNIEIKMFFLNIENKEINYNLKNFLINPDINKISKEITEIEKYEPISIAIGNAFSRDFYDQNIPLLELGFPYYRYHCLNYSPYFGFMGYSFLANRILNTLL